MTFNNIITANFSLNFLKENDIDINDIIDNLLQPYDKLCRTDNNKEKEDIINQMLKNFFNVQTNENIETRKRLQLIDEKVSNQSLDSNQVLYDKISNKITNNSLELREKILNIETKLVDVINEKKNIEHTSIIKGTKSEDILYNILTDTFQEYEIERTSALNNSADFKICYKDNTPILFENKIYKTTVPKKEVVKFINDIKTHNCNGVFISQTSGISSRSNFEIEFIDKNIVLYIHNNNYNQDHIKLAVKAIESISEKIKTIGNEKDFSFSKEEIKEMNDEIKKYNNQLTDLKTSFKEFKTGFEKLFKNFQTEFSKIMDNITFTTFTKLNL